MVNAKSDFPYKILPVEPKLNGELLEYFHGERTGFVQVGPEKYFFPQRYEQEAAAYYNFQARPSDVWVVTFPRSGTTWTQELVWLLANNLDFDAARREVLSARFPFFEFPLFMHDDVKMELRMENAGDMQKLDFIEQLATPGYVALDRIPRHRRRFIKTHFPFSLMPPSVMQQKCKIVYVFRNPKDVAVSYYHLNRLFRTQGYVGDFPRYWSYFERGLNPWMPYYSHLREAQAHSQRSNVLLLRYEDMVADLRATISKVGNFLECSISDASRVDKLMHHLNVNNFRCNPSVNGHEMDEVGILNKEAERFVRASCKGAVGEQKEFAANPELLRRANKWISEQQDYAEESFIECTHL